MRVDVPPRRGQLGGHRAVGASAALPQWHSGRWDSRRGRGLRRRAGRAARPTARLRARGHDHLVGRGGQPPSLEPASDGCPGLGQPARVVARRREEARQLGEGPLVGRGDTGGGREGGIREVDDVGRDVGGDEAGLRERQSGRTRRQADDAARPSTGGDEALVAQRVERRADGRPAEAELGRQGALARQARADEEASVRDEASDAVGEAAVGRPRERSGAEQQGQ